MFPFFIPIYSSQGSTQPNRYHLITSDESVFVVRCSRGNFSGTACDFLSPSPSILSPFWCFYQATRISRPVETSCSSFSWVNVRDSASLHNVMEFFPLDSPIFFHPSKTFPANNSIYFQTLLCSRFIPSCTSLQPGKSIKNA